MEGRGKMEDGDDEAERSKQQLWSWGAGTDGQLATGRLEDNHFPQLVHLPFLSSFPDPISLLSCGGAHVVALTSGGRLVTWGRGSSGQLGHGDLVSCLDPKPVMALNSVVITNVSAGWGHSGFVSDDGNLYTCGDGSFGQLGHGDYGCHCSPAKVSFFADMFVEQVACGMRHSLALLKGFDNEVQSAAGRRGSQVYGFGAGKRGQLGISKGIKSSNTPIITCGFEDAEITSISASGDHSAALSSDGNLFTWGRGLGAQSDAYSPVVCSSSLSLSKVALGWNHALTLTGDGKVYMLGGNHHGNLGDSERTRHEADSSYPILERIHGLDEIKVSDIAAGAEHSALITEEGVLKTWGWGEHGQLGLGNTCNQTIAQTVKFGENFHTQPSKFKVFCGSGFTFAIRTPFSP